MPTSSRLATIKRIQEIYTKLSSEALVAEELEELVRLTTRLHESAVILRYKAAEERVFDKPKTKEVVEEAKPKVAEKPKEKPSTIDFSIFEEKKEEVKETMPEVEEPKLDFAAKEEENVEVVKETVTPVENKPSPGSWSAYFDKVLQDHASAIETPLSALAGSFGLNERILYINALFNKEAETFSELIQKMDQLSDWNSCVDVLSNEASSRSWDKEDDTTGEFILHIKRRYA